jgi:hypothetical protein
VTSPLLIRTAGERIRVESSGEFRSLILEAGVPDESSDPPGLTVIVDSHRQPFDVTGWAVGGRGIWTRPGEAVVRNACSSGFDMHVAISANDPTFTFRWRPPARERAASSVLRSRTRLLQRSVLIQYPAMWRAALRDRAPIHASGCTVGPLTVLITGASGVGKTTLVAGEIKAGEHAVSDNLLVTDGQAAWGVVEPMRSESGSGRRMAHGRREAELLGRVPMLRPNHLLLLRRHPGRRDVQVRACAPEEGTRALIAATYQAGELRRFWSFVAVLAGATGLGPPHPPVSARCRDLASSVECLEMTVAGPPARLRDLLRMEEVTRA